MIALVKEPLSPLLSRKGVIDIEVQEIDEILDDSDPSDKRHEGMPTALRCATPKDIAPVHIALGMKGDDLLDLPEWMHGREYGHSDAGRRQVPQFQLWQDSLPPGRAALA